MSEPASGEAAAPDPVAEIVKGYLVDHVRSLPAADPDLFDRAFSLYDAAERAYWGGRLTDRLRALVEHPALRGLLKLLGVRAAGVFEVALRIAKDNRKMMEELRRRLAEQGIDPVGLGGREEATAEYERVLVETVPLETSLENVEGIAASIELARDYLNPSSRWKEGLYGAAWSVLLPFAVSNHAMRAEIESLREELAGDPERLSTMAELVREAGPEIVRGAYRRGGGASADVLPSGER